MKKESRKNGTSKVAGHDALAARPKKILVADDDAGICDVYTIIFEKAGYTVDLKTDGEDLMANNFILPDFFLIDKQLSGYNGLDVCRHLKSQAQTKDIPVVIISAAPNIGSLSRQAGADGFLEKPFDLNELLETVRHFTRA